MRTTTRISGSLAVAALAVSMFAPTAAMAGADRGQAVRSGHCGAAAWKVKAKEENFGRMKVEVEIDARAGQQWRVRLFHGNKSIHNQTHRTHAPSGSFTINKFTANRAGADRFRVRAVRVGDRQKCAGRVRL